MHLGVMHLRSNLVARKGPERHLGAGRLHQGRNRVDQERELGWRACLGKEGDWPNLRGPPARRHVRSFCEEDGADPEPAAYLPGSRYAVCRPVKRYLREQDVGSALRGSRNRFVGRPDMIDRDVPQLIKQALESNGHDRMGLNDQDPQPG
jgi:hypothetical protein